MIKTVIGILVISSSALASNRFDIAHGFPSIGSGISNESDTTVNQCVIGNKLESKLPVPEVTYRLFVSNERGGSKTLTARMDILISRTSIDTPAPGLIKKVSAKDFTVFCGDRYVSANLSGAYLSFGIRISDIDAEKIPTIGMHEYNNVSRAEEFSSLVASIVDKHLGPNQYWPLKQSAGPIVVIEQGPTAKSFDAYRDIVLSAPEKAALIQGEAVIYPPDFISKMVKQ